jgi:hypothetical protein
MKKIVLIGILLSMLTTIVGQEPAKPNEGAVSYTTSQHVYVKFKSTRNISVGDTLFMVMEGGLRAALRVTNLSSISCVCTPLIDRTFNISERVFTKVSPDKKDTKPITPVPEIEIRQSIPDTITDLDSMAPSEPEGTNREQKITGRISVASYFNLSDTPYGNSYRMRYTIALNVANIRNSRLSAETYISFSHKNNEWGEIKSNVYNGLKIYNLALKYEIGKNTTLWAGRKINPKISNMGAVDGLQCEFKTKSLTTGILAGSRPDYRDYSFNTSLFQYGVFVNHEGKDKNRAFSSTIAFVEQKNAGSTDRRFTYLQHSNALFKNLNLFGSAEFALYRYKIKALADSSFLAAERSPKLSNLYLSARYRFNSRLSASFSYSARNNIVYYETYKSLIDRMIESEMQQGYQLQANYRAAKKLSFGASGGYRFRKDDGRASSNLYTYATYSQVPYINVSATLSATLMSTNYLNGNIFALSLSRDIIKGKLTGTFGYRYIDYNFINTDFGQVQHTGEINLSWKIVNKLTCSVYYEGALDSRNIYNRFYIQLTRRL